MAEEREERPVKRQILVTISDHENIEKLHIDAEGIDSDIVEADLLRALAFIRRLIDVRVLKQELARGVLLGAVRGGPPMPGSRS